MPHPLRQITNVVVEKSPYGDQRETSGGEPARYGDEIDRRDEVII